MSAPFRPLDPRDVLDALAFQSNILTLATALEAAQSDESNPDFAALTVELRRLEQVASETAQARHNLAASVPRK